MRRLLKKIIVVTIVIAIAFTLLPVFSFGHTKDGHNSDLEQVLFGHIVKRADWPSDELDALDVIEKAAYLALDQYNGNGKEELEYLLRKKIPGIPKKIKKINYKANYKHREYTHKGWDFDYSKGDPYYTKEEKKAAKDEANWKLRKKILTASINEVFDFGLLSNRKKCDAFAALVYYVHIIGDHIEDKKANNDQIQIAYGKGSKKTGIIDELLTYLETLFKDQKKDQQFIQLKEDLNSLKKITEKYVNEKGDLIEPNTFEDYHDCAETLLDLLDEYIPDLLQKEDFFTEVFYSINGSSKSSKDNDQKKESLTKEEAKKVAEDKIDISDALDDIKDLADKGKDSLKDELGDLFQSFSGFGSGDTYESLFEKYSEKIKEKMPGLVKKYAEFASAHVGDTEGLAKQYNEIVGELAEIANEGVEKMATVYLKDLDYSTYEEWSKKLFDVYMEFAGQIIDE